MDTTSLSDLTRLELKKKVRLGKLNLVDLAGSERVRVSGATGKRLEEVHHAALYTTQHHTGHCILHVPTALGVGCR